MRQDPNLTIGTFRPGECSRWPVKGQLVTLINSFPMEDGTIQKEKNIECNYKTQRR